MRKNAKNNPSPTPTATDAAAWRKVKDAARRRMVEMSLAGREIGPIPPPVDAARRAATARDFRRFCESYFPGTFALGWSADHLRVIADIERAVLHGGLFAMAMPRGSGKTSLCETACVWALLHGHRDFVVLLGADAGTATDMLEAIKGELENNDLLAEDYPEACHPIRALEGIHQRMSGQLLNGKPTHMTWTADRVTLPTVTGSPSSGGVLRVAGLTGRIRGMKHKGVDGVAKRPSLVVVDDPQTDESARSASQCDARERVLAGAVLGLAGPGKKIAGLMTLTILQPNDLAQRLLDPKRNPHWHGRTTKMLYAFPTATKLWEQYADIRRESLTAGGDGREATAFYVERRAEMDEGAIVAWGERKKTDEASAVQHAMNLWLQDPIAFAAEYQNEPALPSNAGGDGLIPPQADAIMTRGNRLPRGVVPLTAGRVTAFVDIHARVIYWMVVAWGDDFGGGVLDYGTYPEQPEAYFTLRSASRTLLMAARGAGPEGAIYAGLERVTGDLFAREWRREDGQMLKLERCLIDAGWGPATDLVYQFARRSPFAANIMPSHGKFVGAAGTPFAQWRKEGGTRAGPGWRIPAATGARAARHVTFDSNFWKSFIFARLALAVGESGGLTLWGRGNEHKLLADHLTSERGIAVTARGRTVTEWRENPANPDNHWLDCLVGCAVGAAVQGVPMAGIPARSARGRVKLSERWGQGRR